MNCIKTSNVDSRGRIWSAIDWRNQRNVEYGDTVLVGIAPIDVHIEGGDGPLPLCWFTTMCCSKGEVRIPPYLRRLFDLEDGGKVKYIMSPL